jgi:uncharacterized protein YycO
MRGRGLVSAAIRWQTREQDWSHAALLANDDEVIEAWQGDGVRRKRMADWADTLTCEVPTTPEEDARITGFAESKLGCGYDYRSVLRFVTRRRPSEDDRWFCSELVFAAFLEGGIVLLDNIVAAAVSPAHLRLPTIKMEIARDSKPPPAMTDERRIAHWRAGWRTY